MKFKQAVTEDVYKKVWDEMKKYWRSNYNINKSADYFINEVEQIERKNGTYKEWVDEFKGIKSIRMDSVPLIGLLKHKDHLEAISRIPQQYVDLINKNYKLNIKKTASIEGDNPERYEKYSKFNPSTAKPSFMFRDFIGWGVGRMIAALIRGDDRLTVIRLNSSNKRSKEVDRLL